MYLLNAGKKQQHITQTLLGVRDAALTPPEIGKGGESADPLDPAASPPLYI